ncbi:hypothetical protein MMC30_005510 [Trapelia coarctata]|nr:hypothetical protein [Trapelia coarctata]
MSSSEDEMFFDKPMKWWHRTSRLNGIRAVMQRWGDPSDIPGDSTKTDMLAIALPVVEGFLPQPDFDVVKALISMTDPPAQQPEPRRQSNLGKMQVGVKSITKLVPGSVASSPGLKKGEQTVRSSSPGQRKPVEGSEYGTDEVETPENPDEETLENPEEGLEDTPKEGSEEDTENSEEGLEDDLAEGPDLTNTSRTFRITLDRPDTDGQITLDSAQLLPLGLIDGLRAYIARSFHCPPKLATDVSRTIVPKRNVEQFGDPEAIDSLNLEDLFNDTDDPCIDLLRLHANYHTYRLHPSGKPYLYHGRGPVWNKVSGPLDCCIVVARLLDLGFTQADSRSERVSEWRSSLDEFGQRCLQTFYEDWGILTPGESINRRDTFYDYIVDQYNSSITTSRRSRLRTNAFNSPSLLWQICTSEMAGQFGYAETTRITCTSCDDEEYRDVRHQGFIQLSDWDAEEQPSMEQMLQWHFAAPHPSAYRVHEACTGEGGPAETVAYRRHLIVDEILPSRLAVRPNSAYTNIRGATDDNITFTYTAVQAEDGNDSERTLVDRSATYRWLGGIYTLEHHCRVYWQDSNYASSTRQLQVYDGMKACGAILGGFPPHSPGYKVPPVWARGASILFYERLNEDNKDLVLEGVQEMLADLSAEPAETQGPNKKKRRRSTWFPY